ncbi:hypothetical protein jhhlp_000710 [Lomentospora prolificans]|uniref:N-acetylglucosaminylphosphatidylinositol deacetylase n=1 Tax=Lomentospora prolificans TaxID=41688 RepID=A0A2N3NJ97_9PEZI|nr:hypothetical protein jhhlp_000710 [Lomentospora prolificans]
MFRSRLFLIAFVILIPLLYLDSILSMAIGRLPGIRNKRITLLIAHPDDEAMFFAPTVMALTRPEARNHVTILCLSSGNAEGLGETRKRELVDSALVLGLKREDDVSIVDNPVDFPDSMTASWSAEKVASLLSETFTSILDQSPMIDTLITFDSQGISSHPNHISLFHGAKAFIASLAKAHPNNQSLVDLYTLTTVSFVRKYSGIFDAIATTALSFLRENGNANSQQEHETENDKSSPRSLIYLHGLGRDGWLTAKEAMTAAHASQMKWFRYGWIILSRYMYVNDLRLETT